MKQLHKPSSLHISQTSQPHSPKPLRRPRSLPRSLNYLLKEHRLLFILVGILISSIFFLLRRALFSLSSSDSRPRIFSAASESVDHFQDPLVEHNPNGAGRLPVGIGSKRRRIVVTGGEGFVGSHLVDKLIARGDDVIVVDNFFTGRKENLVYLFGNPRFELIGHDVVEPILLEVDQIYHLACPVSPVHYKIQTN